MGLCGGSFLPKIMPLTIEHLDAVQNMATNIDTGYSDFEAEKWCKLIYFPSPMTPKRNLSKKVLWWIYMENYESSLDTQTLDVKRLEIEKCAYMNCGFTFLDIHSHYWQFHPEYIKPNMRMTNYTKNTVTGLQKFNMGQLGSNQEEKTDSVDTAKPQEKKELIAVVAQPAKDESCNVPDMKMWFGTRSSFRNQHGNWHR